MYQPLYYGILYLILCIVPSQLAWAHAGHLETDDNLKSRQQAAQAVKGKDVIINGEVLRYATLIGLVLENFPIWDRATIPTQINFMLDNQINATLLSQEAKKQGWEQEAALKAKLDALVTEAQSKDSSLIPTPERVALAQRDYLAQTFLENHLNQHIPDEHTLKQHYQQSIEAMGLFIYKTNKIVTTDLNTANQLRERYQQGETFSDLAKQFSIDYTTRHQGGELGWILAKALPPDLANVLKDLSPMTVSKPINTPSGYTLLLVEAVKPNVLPDFDAVKPTLTKQYQTQQALLYINQLRSQARIEK